MHDWSCACLELQYGYGYGTGLPVPYRYHRYSTVAQKYEYSTSSSRTRGPSNPIYCLFRAERTLNRILVLVLYEYSTHTINPSPDGGRVLNR